MVSKTTSIHRVEEKKENFKRRLYGNKTYITVKEEARENPKPRVNYLREVIDDGVRDAVNFLLQKEEKPLSVKVVVSEVITNLIR